MTKGWSGQIAIVGIGESDLGVVSDKDPMQLHAQAAKQALEDCGLKNTDVDGVLTAGIANQLILMHSVMFAEYMGIQPRFTTSMQIGGATHIQLLISAANAIHAGMADVVLVAAADSIRSFVGYGEFLGMMGEGVTELFSRIGHTQFECPYGPTLISTYAMGATRHMHEFGTTVEQMAQVAMISWPLTKDMCSIISDGGGAFIVTSAERARDLKKEPALILGAGARSTQEHVSLVDDVVRNASADAGRQAYEMSGLGPKDMDFAQLYDCFSITPILFLEDFGFCEKGEGGPFVEGGQRIEIGGDIPIVTHGGCHAHCHPGLPSGIFHINEAVKQLRGEAGGKRQVKNAHAGLVNGLGGHFSSHTAVIVGVD